MNQNQNQQLKMNVSIKDTVPVICEECKNDVFTEGLKLRKVSRFLSGTDKDGIIPIPVFYCAKCGHVNSDMNFKEPTQSEA